jgi:serine-type D-Ala-D-Ala carboxypeptidase/endopeptidase
MTDEKILKPLGMTMSGTVLSDAMSTHLTPGHDNTGSAMKNWDFDALAGAGAIRSTANDMLRYLKANMGTDHSPLADAMKLAQQPRSDMTKTIRIGLAWMTTRKGIIWHNGQTGGYHSFAAFSPEKRAGVVVLANSAALYLDELGSLLLQLVIDGHAQPLKIPQPIKLNADALEPFVGRYRLNAFATATVTRDGDQLFVELTGQPKAKVHPESATRFFYRAVEAAVSFETGDDGAIKEMVIHQNGQDIPAAREK